MQIKMKELSLCEYKKVFEKLYLLICHYSTTILHRKYTVSKLGKGNIQYILLNISCEF